MAISKFRSLLGRAARFLKERIGSPRPAAKPSRTVPGGHRGVALGNKPKDESNEAAMRAWTSKWRNISPEAAEGFLYDNEILFVNSSNVAALQYFPEDQKMMVEFLNGSAYLYSGVTPTEAQGFVQAQSKGKNVWDVLRVRGSKTAHKKRYTRIK